MSLSGTYNFGSAGSFPNTGELGLYAFGRCGIRQSALLQEHMWSLRMAANLVCATFSNKQVNLWQVELVSQPLTQGVATYNVNPEVVLILDAYRTQGTGEGTIDQILIPVSRTEYASYTNKQDQGVPSVFWFNRLLQPNLNLYLTPDGTWPMLNYYAVNQLMDANLTNGGSVDIPAVWTKAYVDELAAELALTWAPDRYQMLADVAAKSYLAAADTNIEDAPNYVSPMLGSYWNQ